MSGNSITDIFTNYCEDVVLSPNGAPPSASMDTYQTKICLYNTTTNQYEQYFKYVTTNPDNSQTNFYLYENLGAKLSVLPSGSIVPCVMDVHVVNDSGIIYATVDCNNDPAVKVFDTCVKTSVDTVNSSVNTTGAATVSSVNAVKTSVDTVNSSVNTTGAATVSSINAVKTSVDTVNSSVNTTGAATVSSVNAVKTSVDTVNSSVNTTGTATVSSINAVKTSVDTVNSSVQESIPLLTDIKNHVSQPAGKIIESTIDLPAGTPTLILNATNRRVAIISWFNTSDKREALNIGFNGTASIGSALTLRYGQPLSVYGYMTYGEVWGICNVDMTITTTEFID